MCFYQRATAGLADASGAALRALKTWTSAWEGVYLEMEVMNGVSICRDFFEMMKRVG